MRLGIRQRVVLNLIDKGNTAPQWNNSQPENGAMGGRRV
jgi:hypothetical protein